MITTSLNKILFYDIECTTIQPILADLEPRLQGQWINRSEKINGVDFDHAEWYRQEGSYSPEFSKVVCIAFGYFTKDNYFKVKSICGKDEVSILTEFKQNLEAFKLQGFTLCGHNIKDFDGPFLGKRYLVNRMPLPAALNNTEKKPWDITDIDTMELWKFGSFKGKNVSLELLSAIFNIPSPKVIVDGSQVHDLFFAEKYEEIAKYCAGDVVTSARVLQAFMNKAYVKDEMIQFV